MKTRYLLLLGCWLFIVPSSFSQTPVSGTITTNTTWTSGTGYVLTGSLTIRSGAILTIETGVTVELASYNINVGSSTVGGLNANGATFVSGHTSDHKILFQDGSNGTLRNCAFDNVYVDIEADAGASIQITGNHFANTAWPLTCDINRVPTLSGNSGSIETIGISGTVSTDLTLPILQWAYTLTATVTVRSGAVLTLNPGIIIDLKNSTLAVGSSSAGELTASGVQFNSSSGSDKKIYFKDGGKGNISNSSFNNVFIDMDPDAGRPVVLTGNTFANVQYPLKMNAVNAPEMTENMAEEEVIAIKGSVTVTSTLPRLEWDYILSENLTVRDGAVLTVSEGCRITLAGKYIYVGASVTSTGTLNGSGVHFLELPCKSGRFWYRGNSGGTLTGCRFDGCRIQLEGGSPTITNSRFYHSSTAILVHGASDPDLHDNDFYNNETAIDHQGELTLRAANNWWGHPSGPVNVGNPNGKGETVKSAAALVFEPFLEQPATGPVSSELVPPAVDLGYLITGQKRDSSLIIRNTGEIDLLIHAVSSVTSLVSVESPDRFWILPDSSVTIPFSFTALEHGIQRDTILLHTNEGASGLMALPVLAEGRVDNIHLNFYHIDVDSFPVVECHFSVTDQSLLPVRALTAGNVTVSEQGISVTPFELIGRTTARAVKVALVMDRSGSMSGVPLRDAKNAASDFIRQLSPMDQAALISFADSPSVDQGLTVDQEELLGSVNSLKAEGNTALFDAIDLSMTLVRNLPGIRAILVLSDGKDNRSSKTAADIINSANSSGINVYTIGLGRDADPSLQMMALQTGGMYFYSPTSGDLVTIYRMISGQLQNLYLLRYTADEELPFPRRVDLGVDVYGLRDSAVRYYGMGNTTVDLTIEGSVFKRRELSVESKGYFYYRVDPDSIGIPEGMSFTWYMESDGHAIPCGGEYMGSGIMQFWADFRGISQPGSYPVTFPDSVSQSGGWLIFDPKPAGFTATLTERPVTQTIDIFAGGSVGVSALAGGVAAGPSVAAAKATASGTGGVGIRFERDISGNEKITRRMEAGVAGKVETPSVNTVIDAVNVGASVEVTTKGTAAQTLLFPINSSDNETIIKAKAAYLLETLSYGGMAVSPYFAIVLNALQSALVAINPDVTDIYSDLFESWNVGVSTEGKIGVEFKIAPAKNSGLPEFTLAEASASMGLGADFTHFVQTNDVSMGIRFATAYDLGLINLEVGKVKLGSVFKYKHGAEVSAEAQMHPNDGLNQVSMEFLSYDQLNLNLLQGYYGDLYSVTIPEAVIEKAETAAGNFIHDLALAMQPANNFPSLRVGTSYFADALDAVFGYDEDSLENFDDHILITSEEQFTKGLNVDIKIALDAALIVGLGVEFGVAFSYLDQLAALTSESVIAQGMILPMAEYNGVSEADVLFSLKDEVEDLIDGAIDLVVDGILNLIDLGEYLVDAGIDLITSLPGEIGELGGTLEESGKIVIGVVDPRNWFLSGRPLEEPQLVRAYWSPRVTPAGKPDRYKSGSEESNLYLVSKAVNIVVFNQAGEALADFAPLALKMGIDGLVLGDLGFGEDEKNLARIYRYNPGNLSWTPFLSDLSPLPDTVGANITLPGTYAIGIEISASHDKTPPGILEYYPAEGGSIAPQARIWISLAEPATETGIDFSRTTLLIDGTEVDAAWDPVNGVISFASPVPLSLGDHQYTLIASDYQGNATALTVPFKVIASGTGSTDLSGDQDIHVYPNPSSEGITIGIKNENYSKLLLEVYDTRGIRVKTVYQGDLPPGIHQFTWDRSTNKGMMAGNGIYFIRQNLNGKISACKVVVK